MNVRRSLSGFAMLSLVFVASCFAEEEPTQGPGEPGALAEPATAASSSALDVDWYYTCADTLLACSPGYGAVEWVYYPDCIPYGASHRVKCVSGSIDP